MAPTSPDESSETADAGGGARPVTVLVADDSDVALRLCRRVLEKAGYKVLTASGAREAMSVALAESPEVILLDHAMPGMDSLEAMRQIKQRRPGIAIVIATVLPTESDHERYVVAGADDVLIKPFALSDLVAVVAKLTSVRSAAAPTSERRKTIPKELRRTVGQAREIAALTGQFPISKTDRKPQFDFRKAADSIDGFHLALIHIRGALGEIARAHGALREFVPIEKVDAWSRVRLVPGTELNALPWTAILAARKSWGRLFALARSIELETDLASKEQRDWSWSGAERMFTTQARVAMDEVSQCDWDELIQGRYIRELADESNAFIDLVQRQLLSPPKPNRPADEIRRSGSAHEEHVYGAYRWCAVCGWIELMAVPIGVHALNSTPSGASASQTTGARSERNSGGRGSSQELNEGLSKAMEHFFNLMHARNSPSAAVSAEPPVFGTADMSGGRPVTVLVADDNEVAQRLCRRVLEKAGYSVLTASDGLEAVSLALANSPDMILLDVAMPGMKNGLETIREIKEQRPGMAIVIASAHLLPSDREMFLAAGADDMLIPPLRLSELVAVVAKFTANRGPQMKNFAGTRLGSYETVEPIVKTVLKETTLDLAMQALDARDPSTASHSSRVSELAGVLGEHLGLGDHEVELLRTAGSLHDLGMIGVRDDVLNKPASLNEKDWELMRRHPDIGADMIAQHPALAEVAPLVRHHHERWDGTGYPAGLKGDMIPFGARILAVADSFDAITSARIYTRSVMTPIEAVEDVSRRANHWYDPGVINALREVHGLSPL